MNRQHEGISGRNIKQASIYARTSSPNQRDNYSIDEQINQCQKYCEQRGWSIRYVFVDESQSGKSIDNRPKFQLMMQKAKSQEFGVIVVWKLDRFARSLVDLVNVEKTLRGYGVELCSVTEFVDTTTSVGRFNYRSLASVAELERELIGERSRLGMYALAREGRWPSRHAPLGYEVDPNGRLYIHKSEATLVKRIFNEYSQSSSMPELAFALNLKMLPSKLGTKGAWTSRAVKNILSNKIYIGKYKVAGFETRIESLRIIDDDLFLKTQNKMARFRLGSAKRPPMPVLRKASKLNRILNAYTEYLSNLS